MIQIFILSYNRPELVCKSVKSALAQDYKSFEVIVSDNSTNDDTQTILLDLFANNKRFKYIRRVPSLPWHDHYNIVLSEATTEFFMIFHDDDVMHTNMISSMIEFIINDNSIVAVGANAFVIKKGNKQGLMLSINERITVFENSSDFIRKYLNDKGCIPFPAYLYRNFYKSNSKFDKDKGGKYCDVSFLMSLFNRGKILWINTPLMNYHIHNAQISAFDVFEDRIKLIRHIVTTTKIKSSDPQMKAFRLINIYGEFKNRIFNGKHKITIKWYLRLIFMAIKYSPKKVLPRLIYFSPKVLFQKESQL